MRGPQRTHLNLKDVLPGPGRYCGRGTPTAEMTRPGALPSTTTEQQPKKGGWPSLAMIHRFFGETRRSRSKKPQLRMGVREYRPTYESCGGVVFNVPDWEQKRSLYVAVEPKSPKKLDLTWFRRFSK